MLIARLFQGLIVGLLLVGLFVIGGMVFFITVSVLAGLGIVQWLRGKGIIANKTGGFAKHNQPDGVIDGEYHEVSEVEIKITKDD